MVSRAPDRQNGCQLSNAGALPPPSARRTLRQLWKAFLPPGPRRLRTIRRRERDEYGMGAEGVDEMTVFRCADLAARTLSPLVGEKAKS